MFNKKRLTWSLGAISIVGTISVLSTVVSCGTYVPNNGDLSTRNFLSGKHAYNKILADYYKNTTNQMFAKKSISIDSLRYDTFVWYVKANMNKDIQYWTTQENNWIKNGTFIDTSKGSTITDIISNKNFINNLFTTMKLPNGESVTNYKLLKTDKQTYDALVQHPGSGVIMSVNRILYQMSYLLLTNSKDVQNWLQNNSSTSPNPGSSKLNIHIENNGEYFFINYLWQNKPFIMWNQKVTDRTKPSWNAPISTVADFNKLANSLQTKSDLSGSLDLPGNGDKPKGVDTTTLNSFKGLQTTNPFLKNGSTSRGGDIALNDNNKGYRDYIKTNPGGKQGWLHDDGSITIKPANPVSVDANTRYFAFIQQLLPGYKSGSSGSQNYQYAMPDWMNKTTSGTTQIASKWNTAFQIIFNSTNVLSNAKNYWIHNGYNLTINIPVLEDNLSGAHLYK